MRTSWETGVPFGPGSLARTTLASQFAQSDLIIAGGRSTAMAVGCWLKLSHAKLRIGMNHPQGGGYWLTAQLALYVRPFLPLGQELTAKRPRKLHREPMGLSRMRQTRIASTGR